MNPKGSSLLLISSAIVFMLTPAFTAISTVTTPFAVSVAKPDALMLVVSNFNVCIEMGLKVVPCWINAPRDPPVRILAALSTDEYPPGSRFLISAPRYPIPSVGFK